MWQKIYIFNIVYVNYVTFRLVGKIFRKKKRITLDATKLMG